jgi:hypothetical protein
MTKYMTNYSRGCFDHWTASHAISELVSNYLDSDGEQEHEFTEDTITLTNKGIEVSNKMLMSGMSDKRGDDTKRGTFGIGSIQCMVVLCDLGIDMKILNNGKQWVPTFEYNEQFDADIMVINETVINSDGNFSVIVEGLDQLVIEEVVTRCSVFQDREVLYSTEVGDIISTIAGTPEIFVGDMLVMQTTDFKYSYNFKPNVVPLTQDRNVMDLWELRKLTARLISMIDDEVFVKEAIRANKYDTRLVADSWYTSTPKHAAVEVMGQEFVDDNEGATVTSSYSDHQEAVKLGNKSVYIENEVEVTSIKQSDVYKESIADIEIIEVPTVQEVMEAMKVRIMDLLEENLCQSEIDSLEEILDPIITASRCWSGDVEDLPF